MNRSRIVETNTSRQWCAKREDTLRTDTEMAMTDRERVIIHGGCDWTRTRRETETQVESCCTKRHE